MTGGNVEALEGEQSLAHFLEFLARLENETEVKEKVIEEIKEKVEKYLKDVKKFCNNGYLSKTISKSKKLRTDIVASEQDYKYFTQSFDNDSIDETDYAKHLINNIFPLFGCLYYMYYECATECLLIKGGDWQSEQCNGKDLNNWLKDEKSSTDTSDDGTKRMIKRGFEGVELSKKQGKDLFPSFSSTDGLLEYHYGSQLHFALYYMLFLPDHTKWNNAQSGHAVLFLRDFCEKVKDGEFQDKYSDNGDSFKSACQEVSAKISELTTLNIVVPVACYQTGMYRQILEATHFWAYITWLQGILEHLIDSLTKMVNDMNNWKEVSLKTSTTFGPFPWGFTFYDGSDWQSNREDFKSKLQDVTETLLTFEKALDTIKQIPSSPTASTLGGVAGGLGAVGAAGAAGAVAAYTGFLGPVAEGIGKFFRGLVL